LVLFSLVLVLVHEWGMNRVLSVAPTRENTFIDTDVGDHGATVAQMEWTDSSVILRYDLRQGAPYPYAGLQIRLAENPEAGQGMDFSEFDSLCVHIKTLEGRFVRIYLRNWNAAYSGADPVSLKFNELEYQPSEEPYPAHFLPAELRVASWWVSQRKINVHEAALDISNVPLIEIQTGSGEALGAGWLEVSRIEFKGKLISAERLYLGILFVWVVFAIGWLAFRFYNMSQNMKAERAERLKLERLHSLLEIQAKDYERMAKNDALTGVMNRNGFRDVLVREIDEFQKTGAPLSVILFDIDLFKQVNDTYGHTAGDEALQRVSAIAAANIRKSDSLVRWGGEEFVILCPGTAASNAALLAEKLRRQIKDTPIGYASGACSLTCSFGVAEMRAREAMEAVFERVDSALYEAKRTGRNRVVVK
jgi:diguanylate cyclase (GGDEF)-like protein